MNDDLDLFFFFNQEKNLLKLTHEKSIDVDDVECFHMAGKNLPQMEACAHLGLMCFNIGNLTKGKGEVSISPKAAVFFLEDICNKDVS